MRSIFGAAAALLLLFDASHAIIFGEPIIWNNYAYLVKVLGRGQSVKNCVGTLITPSLVITAPDCVKNMTTYEQLEEFMVVMSGKNYTNDVRWPSEFYDARLVDVASRWALLKIRPLDVNVICPPPPAARRVARLPLNPSLSNVADVRIAVGDLGVANCYMLAFHTVEDGADYVAKSGPQRLTLERLFNEDAPEQYGMYWARIVNNSTACFDDMGAALVCHVAEREEDYVVGMYRFLKAGEVMEPAQTVESYCAQAVSMVFDAYASDLSLLRAIERHDYGGFFDVYEKCDFTEF